VTVIASRCLLPREEPEVGTLLQQVFEAEGITVVTGRVASVVNNKDEDDDNAHTATTSNGDTVVGDVLLVSIGRVPNTKGLGLETVGIELGNGAGIKVNDKLETTCKGIYAAGDCTGDKQL
jgi:pyruvate/2-oxoglutarate dehydrogenase complex dihydrolipoamide dehydrogenase (E3) component